MIVGMMQPTFLPWQGYFGLINSVELFVFLDDFQFCRGTFHHRNRIFFPGSGPNWLTVPVARQSGLGVTIREAEVSASESWMRKPLASIRQAYGKCEYFSAVFPLIEDVLLHGYSSLAELNIQLIERMCECMGIRTECRRSSTLAVAGERSERVLSILRACGGTGYLSARGSFGYMLEDRVFPVPDLPVHFQHFAPQSYSQRQSREFVPFLSMVDALFQVGPINAKSLVVAGQLGADSWDEMVLLNQREGAQCESGAE